MVLTNYFSGRAVWAESFRYRDYRLLWGSSLIHSVGIGMEWVALGWLVFYLTDSPFMVGVAVSARMAPLFFLGVFSGAVADRVDRRLFLRVVTGGSGIVVGLRALILLADVANVWYVIGLTAGLGVFFAFTQTTRQAYTYDIVGPKNALNGLSLMGLSEKFGAVIGAVIAGVLISRVGIGEQYLVMGSFNGLAVLVLLPIRERGQAAIMERESVFTNLVEYVRILQQNGTLRVLLFMTVITEIFGFSHQTLLPVFAKDVLGVGAAGLGVIVAFRNLGGVLGAVLMASTGNFRHKGRLMFAVVAGFGLGQIFFYLTADIYSTVAVLTFISVCAMGCDILYKTLMQENVPNEQRGRAMGSWVFGLGFGPVGHLSTGAIAGALGAPMALLINGSVLAFISVSSAIGMPKIRRLP
jgi:MFS family permease